MITLLVIIYLAFISLGLPDALLGSSWPAMRVELGAPLSMAGILAMFISGCTIISSLGSSYMINRFKTSRVTIFSVALTAIALLGYSFAPSTLWLFFLALPLGLGAGAIDSGLNNFVALHYKAKHMSWLHCFWGIGATAGPFLMSIFLNNNNNWRGAYRSISFIQIALFIAMLFTLPLWKVIENNTNTLSKQCDKSYSNRDALKAHGAKWSLLVFICYCSVEITTGLWSSSYLSEYKNVSAATAAGIVSLYYASITVGRALTGFLTMKFKNDTLILSGTLLSIFGIIIYMLPLPVFYSAFALILIGLGFAPIFPCMLHQTPERFGKTASQTMMGLQMGSAYVGSTFMPLIFGFLAGNFNTALLPYYLFIISIFMLIATKKISMVKFNESEANL